MSDTDILQQVKELSKSNVVEISIAATKALDLVDKLKEQKITKEEFDELLTDVVNLNHISEEIQVMDFYRQMVRAYQTILTLKTLMSLF